MSNSLHGNPPKRNKISACIHFSLNSLIRSHPPQKIGADFLNYTIGLLNSHDIHFTTELCKR